ncbi:MAG: dimethylarginine dimethylaminohydrolase family protein [Thermoplasmatota archaeon]
MSKKLDEMSDMEHPIYYNFRDEEAKKYWDGENFGVTSNFKKLKRVLLHRPGEEVNVVKGNEKHWRWRGEIDAEVLKEDWDRLKNTFEEEGVQVDLLQDFYPDKPYLYFMRDQAVVTPAGAIISRMALTERKGEEHPVMKKLVNLDIPIIYTVHGFGTFEGGNFMFIDDETAVVGESIKTNPEGIRQIRNVLEIQGIEVLEVSVPSHFKTSGGYGHIDGLLSILDEDLAAVFPEGLPYKFLEYLADKGFDLIELPRDERGHLGANLLPIAPRKAIAVEGNEKIKKLLEDHDVEVIEVDLEELIKGGGGPRCSTLELLREG